MYPALSYVIGAVHTFVILRTMRAGIIVQFFSINLWRTIEVLFACLSAGTAALLMLPIILGFAAQRETRAVVCLPSVRQLLGPC